MSDEKQYELLINAAYHAIGDIKDNISRSELALKIKNAFEAIDGVWNDLGEDYTMKYWLNKEVIISNAILDIFQSGYNKDYVPAYHAANAKGFILADAFKAMYMLNEMQDLECSFEEMDLKLENKITKAR